MLTDTRIIGQLGPFLVHGNVHEVQLKDGTRHRLQPVSRAGVPNQYLRALDVGDGVVGIVDVRKLSHDLAGDLPMSFDSDKPAVVAYRLRQNYADEQAFSTAFTAACDVVGIPVPVEAHA